MFTFDMSIDQNYASFKCDESDLEVFIDSLDNKSFSVRLGTIHSTQSIGDVEASSSEELNFKLSELVNSIL